MRFKPGQKLVCTKRDEWFALMFNSVTKICPKFNEVVTCGGYGPVSGYISLVEYPCNDFGRTWWGHQHFEPLIEDSVLEAELQSISEPCTTTN